MNVHETNKCLLDARYDEPGLFPHLEQLAELPIAFKMDFGLEKLPQEPGLILIRGGRQLGKSTWLEKAMRETALEHGPGSVYYLNGDEIGDQEELSELIGDLSGLFNKKAAQRVLFIDEITAVKNWEKALKKLADQGIVRDMLIVTTGSKTIDLRRGTERLPGRKGKLDRSNYRFTPVSFSEFKTKTQNYFSKDKTLWAYILTGGSPVAINGLVSSGRIPEYVVELTRDWVFGEVALQGRSIESMKWVLRALAENGGMPLSLHKLAEVSGLANNTVAQGYVDLLKDLGCLSSTMRLESNKLKPLARKASKYHFTYLLVPITFSSQRVRTLEDFIAIPDHEKGRWIEWVIAQELWRRSAIAGEDSPEQQYFWKSDEHEVDFIFKDRFFESKLGDTEISRFMWFPKVFKNQTLEVVCATKKSQKTTAGFCKILSLEEFLLEKGG
ncbi:MAG: ATP-binding protein [Deltaproteobacteria bacterium]|nr:ATP-binding protein [Deltaproteobacteria bacterium]